MSRKKVAVAVLIAMAVLACGIASSASAFVPGVCKPVKVCEKVQPVPVCQPAKAVPTCGPVKACEPVRARATQFVARAHRPLVHAKNRLAVHHSRHHVRVYEPATVGSQSVKPLGQPSPAPAPQAPAPPVPAGT